jgi:hypothetical protein
VHDLGAAGALVVADVRYAHVEVVGVEAVLAEASTVAGAQAERIITSSRPSSAVY